ncbi:MAG: bifunctional diaminohydroxyphosphoribosylaminopyrimidine deaminase/5-amino-6-(5-phosphoribosylamino)uracil reductase RibD [Planctomycetaceae bacterium]
MVSFPHPEAVMQSALELARQGLGGVEPNPPVGAVIVDEGLNEIASGFHARFGGPHAEIVALAKAGERARGQMMFVTLEPCCHHGKTGPCTEAIIAAGIQKVIVARIDPAAHAAGQGIARLREAGIDVETGLLEHAARKLTAPFAKWITQQLPYVHAKWAMSLDGKIATQTGHSQWISNEASRARVHVLRGRMDAIMIGIGTVLADDPLLTARPAGPRVATRIVVDAHARLPLTSQLVQTAAEAPLIVACTSVASAERVAALKAVGVEVLELPLTLLPSGEGGRRPDEGAFEEKDEGGGMRDESEREMPHVSLPHLLQELGCRGMTNLLLEGGGELLGSAFDDNLIDEYHIFIAPKVIGGAAAVSPIGGRGLLHVPANAALEPLEVEHIDGDLYLHAQTIAAVMR